MSITPEVNAKTLTQLVATEIKVQMARADVRQSQLAREMGKTEQWLSVRLRGRQPIDVNDLLLIARALGVDVHDLVPSKEDIAAAVPGRRDFKDLYLPLTRSADRHGRSSEVERAAQRSASPFGQSGRRDATGPRSRDRLKGRRPPHQRPTVLPT